MRFILLSVRRRCHEQLPNVIECQRSAIAAVALVAGARRLNLSV